MTFFAQVTAAVQSAVPPQSSPIETLGLVGIAYALIRVIDGLIAKLIPGKVGKRTCAWTEADVDTVAKRMAATDEDGRPKVFVPRALERHVEEILTIQRETADNLKAASSTLRLLADRPCPVGKDARL